MSRLAGQGNWPTIIQGGMRVGISGWRWARVVSLAGQLGVVSGMDLDTVRAYRDASARRATYVCEMHLVDRELERAAVEDVITAALTGRGRALVIRGTVGGGVTTLLTSSARYAGAARVVWAPAVEEEQSLPFAGVHALHVLLADGSSAVEELLPDQRMALQGALGLTTGPPPEPFALGLAILALLTAEAELQPVICLVDDAQWLDRPSASVFAFVARRLASRRVAMIFGMHDLYPDRPVLAGVEEIVVGPLGAEASSELLASAVPGPMDAAVEDRIKKEAMGIPLALLELAGQLSPKQLAGIVALPLVLPVSDTIRRRFAPSVASLPLLAQMALLLASAEPSAQSGLFWAAAASLGVTAEATAPAERAGLLRVAERVECNHPLVRLAVYHTAPVADRQKVHRALADACGPMARSLRARHLAGATLTADEETAAELEALAVEAKGRGSYAEALTLLEYAAALSSGTAAARTARMLGAVQAAVAAGSLGRATALLDEVARQHLDEADKMQVERLRGAITLTIGHSADRATGLLNAAKAFEPLDAGLARDTYLEALEVSIHAGRLARETGVASVARAAASASVLPSAGPRASDLLLDGLAAWVTEGLQAAIAPIRLALDALRSTDQARWLSLGALVALEIFDDDALHDLAARQADLERDGSAALAGGLSLGRLVDLDDLISGRLSAAGLVPAQHQPGPHAPNGPSEAQAVTPAEVLAAAWRGLPTAARDLAEAHMRQGFVHERGLQVAVAQHATAVLENSLGRYEAALTSARQACHEPSLYVVMATVPELVEAAARSGERELAVTTARHFAETAQLGGTEWALGLRSRCLALIEEGTRAEDLHQASIEHLRSCRVAPQLARAHLLYGEWLRRERRRREAREQLRTARDMFIFMGANAFADRASGELAVAGEHLGPRVGDVAGTALTPQEDQVARLAVDGASNADIARKLFLSPRTVEYHLHKVFRKLGVSSRTQLARALLGSPALSRNPGLPARERPTPPAP